MGYVRVKGKPIYFGNYDSDASREKYDRWVAEFLTAGRKLPSQVEVATIPELTVNSLCLQFLKYAESYGYSEGEMGRKILCAPNWVPKSRIDVTYFSEST